MTKTDALISRDEDVRDYEWSTRPSASDYVILEGPQEHIIAFTNEAIARQLVKQHNRALAALPAHQRATSNAIDRDVAGEPTLADLSKFFGWGCLSAQAAFEFAISREQLLRLVQELLETHKSNAPNAKDAILERLAQLASLPAVRAETDDEVYKRMYAVVDAAVEWHQAGREGAEWFDKAEVLGQALDSLLELRGKPSPATTTSPTCKHCAGPCKLSVTLPASACECVNPVVVTNCLACGASVKPTSTEAARRAAEEVEVLIGMFRADIMRTIERCSTDTGAAMRELLEIGKRWRDARTAYHTDASLTCREYGEAGDALAVAITDALQSVTLGGRSD